MPRCRSCHPVPEKIPQSAAPFGRRWLLSILYAAHTGAVRYNEFLQAVGRIPPRTLAVRLVELEEAGIFERRVLASRPPTVEYRLTPAGERLSVVVDALRRVAGPAA
jgi:DNA-binding HxlR family transcriptional regulator